MLRLYSLYFSSGGGNFAGCGEMELLLYIILYIYSRNLLWLMNHYYICNEITIRHHLAYYENTNSRR